jgi:Rrf2 family protein
LLAVGILAVYHGKYKIMPSHAAEYALQATLYLAEIEQAEPVSVTELAEVLGAPRNYLSKILGALARGGVLTSLRGPTGGFQLAVRPEELKLAAVVGLFDPPPGRRCLLGLGQCSDTNPCTAHPLWKGIAKQIDGFFRRTTVADLLEASERSAADASAAGVTTGRKRGRARGAAGGPGLTRGKEAKHG